MVQKNKKPPLRPAANDAAAAPKRRGRPRAYEPDVALGKALDLFRKGGFAATSLDDLSAATGMNRPSLYGAFGDKRELYIKSYQRYRDDARAAMIEIFREEMPVRKRLQRIYAIALDIYLDRRKPARLLHGDDGGLRSGGRSRHPRHGAGRICRARQGVRVLLPHGQGEGRDCPRAPIRSCWRNWHPPRCTPSRSARAPACRARSWKRSSRARST